MPEIVTVRISDDALARATGADALAAASIAPLELREKEGLALINGTDGMLGMLLLALHDLSVLLDNDDELTAGRRDTGYFAVMPG